MNPGVASRAPSTFLSNEIFDKDRRSQSETLDLETGGPYPTSVTGFCPVALLITERFKGGLHLEAVRRDDARAFSAGKVEIGDGHD